MMSPKVIEDLGKEEPSDFHTKILSICKDNIKRSRGDMSKKYSAWDMQDEVYQGLRRIDSDDLKQAQEDKPVKMVVPNTYAQIMTFVSFQFLMFKQNDKSFELSPRGENDYGKKWEDCENVIDRDWNRSQGSQRLFQFLLDTARFGVAPLEVTWSKESVKAWVAPTAPVTQQLNGISLTGGPAPAGYQDFLRFEGNKVRNVSPYRWFPDTSFPISEFYKGNYCASEEDFTMGQLRQMEKDGEVQGVKWIKPLARDTKSLIAERGGETRMTWSLQSNWENDNDAAPCVVTKIKKYITPKQFKIGEDSMGEEEFPVLYTVWYANDNRVIKCEATREWHGQFGYGLGQFTPDMHHTVTLGLADLIYRLQDVISWFVNSHITSVRRVIQNRMVINPQLVETKTYDGDGDIFMKKGFGRVDPNMAVRQLGVTDVTAAHMNDVEILGKLMQTVTGVNDNTMGQYNGGRRSAQEARTVAGGAAGRMKMHGFLLWEMGLGRIGNMMLSNSRQSLSFETFRRVIGLNDEMELQARWAAFKGTPEEIICAEDYMMFDSTLSSEKGFMAQNLQELLSLILQANPAAAQALTKSISPTKLVSEMFYLRDGSPVERFKPDQAELMAMAQAQRQEQIQQQQAAEAQQQQMQIQQAGGLQKLQMDAAQHIQKSQQADEMHKQKLRQTKEIAASKPKTNGSRK